MKKNLIRLMSLCLALDMSFSSIVPSFAYNNDESGNSIEKIEYQNMEDENYSGKTNVFAELSSVYKVTIPKYLVLSGETKKADYFVKVEGDIAGYEQVKVVPEENFKLFASGKDSQEATINQDKTIWHVSDFDTDANGTISADGITAGKWTGKFNFNINIEESEKTAGDIQPITDDPVEEHTHVPGKVMKENEIPATCQKEGSFEEITVCDICGKELSRIKKTVEKTEHEESVIKENVKDPTCTEAGSYDEVTICKNCNKELSRKTIEIKAKNHEYKETITNPTCESDGFTTYTCINCNDTYKDNQTKALGHEYKNGVCVRCGNELESLSVEASGFTGVYDSKEHGITVTSSGNTISYSTDNKTWTNTNPSFINAGTYTVYYKVSKDGYKDVTGFEKVEIKKATLKTDKVSYELNIGESVDIDLENVILKSEDSNIASVDKNKITAINSGKTNVIISKENYEDVILNITVKESLYTFNLVDDAEGVDVSKSTKSGDYAQNTPLMLSATPKEGYKFNSWILKGSDDVIEKTNATITMPSNELTAYPFAQAENYDIEYNLDGGKVDGNFTTYTVDDEFILLNPEKEGYEFIGWTGSNGNEPELETKVEKGTTGNLSYTANYKQKEYTIHFDSNGGFGKMDDQVVKMAEDVKLSKNAFTNEHFVFEGWALTKDGDVVYKDEANINKVVEENTTLTLFAKWKLDVKGCILTFDANGGVFDDGNTVNMLGYDPVETTKNTWTLHTSNLADDGTKANTTGINASLQDEDKTKTVSVPNASKLSVTVKYNPGAYQSGTTKIGRLSKPVYSAYTLTVSDKAGNTIKTLANSNPSLITITESNAQTVTFDVTGDSVTFTLNGQNGYGYFATIKGYDASGNEIATKSYTNKKVTGTYKEPTRTGYILGGISVGSLVKEGNEKTKWKKNADGLDMYVLDENYEPKTEILEDTTIYANWIPKVYTISYDLDGGVLAEKELMYKVGDGDIVLSEPTKTGYEFTGWTAKAKGESNFEDVTEETIELTIPNGTYGNLELTAHYADTSIELAGFYAEQVVTGKDENGNDVIEDIDVIFIPYSKLVEDYNVNFDDNSNSLNTALRSKELCNYRGKFVFPSSVTKIGKDSFRNISNVTSVIVPSKVDIGANAFDGCENLLSITFKRGIDSIGKYAFRECKKLNQFNSNIPGMCKIPDNITIIPSGCFAQCNGILNVKLPQNATKIEDGAFSGCSGLLKVDFPDNITEIGIAAFSDCISLKQIKFGENSKLEKIGHHAFSSCRTLKEFTAPKNLSLIDRSAFSDCADLAGLAGLEKINLNTDVPLTIEEFAFDKCRTLKNVYLGKNVIKIGQFCFSDCHNLTTININNCPNLHKIELFTFVNCWNLVSIGNGSNGNVTIPSNITEVAGGAFQYCSKITHMTIPDTVTKLNPHIAQSRVILIADKAYKSGVYTVTYKGRTWTFSERKEFNKQFYGRPEFITAGGYDADLWSLLY